MAKKSKASTKNKSKIKKPNPVVTFFKSRQTQTVIGSFLILFSLFLLVAFISFFFSWQGDQSVVTQFSDKTVATENLLGKVGASLSHFFIYEGFGLGAFIVPYLLFITGLFWLFRTKLSKVIISYNWSLLGMLWISVSLGFLNTSNAILSGVIGYEINEYLQAFLGKTGLGIILLFLFLAYLTIRFKVTPEVIIRKFRTKKEAVADPETSDIDTRIENEPLSEEIVLEEKEKKSEFELSLENLQPTIQKHSDVSDPKEEVVKEKETIEEPPLVLETEVEETEEVGIDVEELTEEQHVTENLSERLLKDFGEFDPKLELGNFKFPTLNLLKQYNESISIMVPRVIIYIC